MGVVSVGADFSREYPDGDPAMAEVFATLIRTGSALYIEVERAMLSTFGVPQSVLNSLAVIEGADRTLTPSEISERLFVSTGTMTGTLDALELQGWIRRIPNPEDRRSVLVQITDEGQLVADRLLPGIRALERAVFDKLTATELATLKKLLGKVLGSVATVAADEPIVLEGRRHRPKRTR